MSEIRVNKVIDEAGTGAVELTQGATLPSGKTLSGAGGLNITGVSTFTGNLTVGGQLTYEDVTNVDALGIITARSGINVTGGNTTIKGAVETVNAGAYAGTELTCDTATGTISGTVNQLAGDISVNTTGIITASKLVGDGSELTGVSGFATALSSDQTSPLNIFFKTPKQVNIGAGTSVSVESDATSGNVAFIRESIIHVAVGATFNVKTNTTLHTNVLGVF